MNTSQRSRADLRSLLAVLREQHYRTRGVQRRAAATAWAMEAANQP